MRGPRGRHGAVHCPICGHPDSSTMGMGLCPSDVSSADTDPALEARAWRWSNSAGGGAEGG
eukprot:5174382-Alexandrium_andersonii.AAC.1